MKKLPIIGVTGLAVVLIATLPQPAYAERVTPPPVPENIQVPAGNKVFLVGHAFDTKLHLPALSHVTIWIRLDPLRAAGHLARRR